MFTQAFHALGFVVLTGLGATAVVSAAPLQHSPDLVVHEWGTFTTVAGNDGLAIDWLPLGGPNDLPCFVEHFQGRSLVKVLPIAGALAPVDYERARAALLARVRMETPVLYFYAPREMSVSVKVRFPRGLMTEWYPHASVTQFILGATTLKTSNATSVIEWPSVRLEPRTAPKLPGGSGESHYYAARATDASAVSVDAQKEKFLFYRGIADFDVPLSAIELAGERVRVRSLGADAVPGAILFERRGTVVGYRFLGTLRGDTIVERPSLNGSIAQLRGELTRLLISAGLFPKEAAAMVETWRDSWFEDGTRLFYLVPPRRVNEILPLEVNPAPEQVVRVFVGRMEVLTAATQRVVQRAIASNDAATLVRYARFLGPIVDRLTSNTTSVDAKARMQSVTRAALASYVNRSTVCE